MYIHSSFVKINLVCLWVNQCEKIDLGHIYIDIDIELYLVGDNQRKY